MIGSSKNISVDKSDEQAAPRKKREKVKVNFFEETADEKELFATSNLSTTLPKTQQSNRQKLLLPVDEHFSSKDFFKLFLKPTAKVI
jgi:hypothetical protein